MTFHIVLPFYGRPDHLRIAVESVLAQTDPDWVLTVIDDRYPESGPREWVRSLGDDRVTYVLNEENLGVSGNFQRSVDLMTGEYSMIMGCDDALLPGFVTRVNALIDAYPTASVIQPGVEVMDVDGIAYRPLVDRVKAALRPRGRGIRIVEGEMLAASLLAGNWAYFPSLVWRVDDIRRHRFDPRYDVVLDLKMLLDLIVDGGQMVLDDEVVFRYRRHRGSVSSSSAVDGRRFVQESAYFAEEQSRFLGLGWRRAARAARLHWSSRLNALTKIPAAASHPQSSVAGLVRHAVGITRPQA